MIDPCQFASYLEKHFQLVCGVPCSYFKGFLAHISAERASTTLNHVLATREDEAVGIASGAALAGQKTVVYLQNSGLGNIGDALTSLAQLYELPMLLLVSYRGLEVDRDFPEHTLMGDVTLGMLSAMELPHWELTEEGWGNQLDLAVTEMEKESLPVVLLVREGVLNR